jgi:phosphatidyl-myo-inositol dimannoside synthase
MLATMIATNDFPPRQGGIESFVFALANRLDPDEVVVYTSATPGGESFDRNLPYRVVRDRAAMLLPTPGLGRRVERAFVDSGCEAVLFGAAAPLALIGDGLRGAGAKRIVGMTHGHETAWARNPLGRRALHRIADTCDVLTYVSEFARRRLAPALPADVPSSMVRLAPGVDTDTFRPGAGGGELRRELGISPDRPVVLSLSRLVARKGQDTLIRALPHIRRSIPEAILVIAGDGPYLGKLTRLAHEFGVQDMVMFAGPVEWVETPRWFDAADVFAMPCRTRFGGLEPEALGIVFLEAQSCQTAAVVGDSGGAAETIQHGRTGLVVDPFNPAGVAAAVCRLLADRHTVRDMGERGREWVREQWSWDVSVQTLRDLLS